jgi:hypothetical protein
VGWTGGGELLFMVGRLEWVGGESCGWWQNLVHSHVDPFRQCERFGNGVEGLVVTEMERLIQQIYKSIQRRPFVDLTLIQTSSEL